MPIKRFNGVKSGDLAGTCLDSFFAKPTFRSKYSQQDSQSLSTENLQSLLPGTGLLSALR